jgi:hypothetical protein
MDAPNRFEPLPGVRHRIEVHDGTEWVVVKAARSWLVLPFLCFWLTMWTAGGVAAIYAFARGEQRGFLAIWLVMWAVGWLFAAATVAWQLGGKTRVGVKGGALAHAWSMPLLGKAKHYDASQVRHLRTASSQMSALFQGFGKSPYPPFLPFTGGSIAFDYGAKTVRLLPEVDEAEGRMIVVWLSQRLPRTAQD